jgi:5,10-methylenetetrahydromethanopterin reductase
MTQLAGEMAEGVVFDNIPLGYVDYAMSQLQKGAQKSGRQLSQKNFTVSNMCIWAVNKDREKARNEARGHLPIDLVTISEREIRGAGFTPEDFEPILQRIFSPQPDAMQQAAEIIPDEIVDAFTISGTPDDCIERICEYEKQGIDLVILGLPTRHQLKPWSMYKLIDEEILPHFRE